MTDRRGLNDGSTNDTDADESGPGGLGRTEVPDESVGSESELSFSGQVAAREDDDSDA